jgi:glycosyltransferase involved in cell wall biosynthesis
MKEKYKPKISIITPSFNMGKYIGENIQSVLEQSYKNFEHIIVDGGSSDDTVDILKKHDHVKWISEPDDGQSDAYNKAIQMAKGDLILCLNADDYLLNEKVFENVIREINKCNYVCFSAFMGNIFVCDSNRNKISMMNNRNRDYSFDDLLNKLPVVIHPGTFFKTDTLKQVGGFTEDVHYIMDYDIFLKCAKVKPIHSIRVNISALRRHDNSKGMSKDSWKFSYEFLKVRKNHGGSFFNKMNLQPLKILMYKFVLGFKFVNWAKQNRTIYWVARTMGITKLNNLTWYEND